MKEITDFLALPPSEKTADEALKIKAVEGIGDWKSFEKSSVEKTSKKRWESLSAPTIERLDPIVKDTLARAGYDLIENNSDDQKRRQELAMMLMQAQDK